MNAWSISTLFERQLNVITGIVVMTKNIRWIFLTVYVLLMFWTRPAIKCGVNHGYKHIVYRHNIGNAAMFLSCVNVILILYGTVWYSIVHVHLAWYELSGILSCHEMTRIWAVFLCIISPWTAKCSWMQLQWNNTI